MSKFFFLFASFFLGIVFGLPMKGQDEDWQLKTRAYIDDNPNEHLTLYPVVLQGRKTLMAVKNPQFFNYLSSLDSRGILDRYRYGGTDTDDLNRSLLDEFDEKSPRALILEDSLLKKRNFDEIDRAGFKNFKRNFDEIDRAGFTSFKRNGKNSNHDTTGNKFKKNFDEIDRAGFNGFRK